MGCGRPDRTSQDDPLTTEPAAIEPDARDWTFVIESGCTECGFSPPDVSVTASGVRASIPRWHAALARPGVALRPSSQVWSPLEYGCHVRDVQRIFAERLALMLSEDNPLFANWDQDATAVEERYWTQDPAVVAAEYADAAHANAAGWERVGADDWDRPGRRSNGSVFTVATLAGYFLHDI